MAARRPAPEPARAMMSAESRLVCDERLPMKAASPQTHSNSPRSPKSTGYTEQHPAVCSGRPHDAVAEDRLHGTAFLVIHDRRRSRCSRIGCLSQVV